MSGTKGHSGGARENTGGAREGAGRKPKEPVKLDVEHTDDPLEFLIAVMNEPNADATLRLRAATAAAKLKRERAGGAGKKGDQKRSAEAAATGKFAPAAPPRLVVNNKR